jgi:hypothetical protein
MRQKLASRMEVGKSGGEKLHVPGKAVMQAMR